MERSTIRRVTQEMKEVLRSFTGKRWELGMEEEWVDEDGALVRRVVLFSLNEEEEVEVLFRYRTC